MQKCEALCFSQFFSLSQMIMSWRWREWVGALAVGARSSGTKLKTLWKGVHGLEFLRDEKRKRTLPLYSARYYCDTTHEVQLGFRQRCKVHGHTVIPDANSSFTSAEGPISCSRSVHLKVQPIRKVICQLLGTFNGDVRCEWLLATFRWSCDEALPVEN